MANMMVECNTSRRMARVCVCMRLFVCVSMREEGGEGTKEREGGGLTAQGREGKGVGGLQRRFPTIPLGEIAPPLPPDKHLIVLASIEQKRQNPFIYGCV
jgi:hypothetical protein